MSDPARPAIDPATDADLTGRQVGDFQLLRRLGRGGMAEVYLAEQLSLKRQVAFKVLRSSLATDETYIKRFHVEAQAAAALVHSAIVQIYDVGCVDGVHYIAKSTSRARICASTWFGTARPMYAPRYASCCVSRPLCTGLHNAASSTAISSLKTSCWAATAK